MTLTASPQARDSSIASQQCYRSYLGLMLVAALSALGLVAALNLIIDPFGIYRVVNLPNIAIYKRSNNTRMAKAEAVRRPLWDAVILGNSRAEMGLDPQHPAWGDESVYNCGLAGTNFDELSRAMELAMQNPRLHEVLLCLDYEDFNPGKNIDDDSVRSLLNPDLNHAEYHLSGLLGINVTGASFDTIKQMVRHRPSEFTPRGLYEPAGPRLTREQWFEFLRGLSRRMRMGIAVSDNATEGLPRLERVLNEMAKRKIRATLVILPCHVVMLECLRAAGRWDAMEQWTRSVVDLVERHNRAFADDPIELWSFKQFMPANEEPVASTMRWYWDPVHFTKELGDVVLDRIKGRANDESGFGARLTAENVEAFLAQVRQDREAFLKTTPWFADAVRTLDE
jgi:hypothetical protein